MPDPDEPATPASPSRIEDPAKHSWPRRYGIAFGLIVLGWLAREAISSFVGPTALPYVFFYPTIACAAWFGGLGPGIFAAVLAMGAARYFFIAPIYSLTVLRPADIAADLAFMLGCSFIIGAIEAMHRARRRLLVEAGRRKVLALELGKARDSLATTLASIGDGVIVTTADGRITFLNHEAERLTRWRSSEAVGQRLETVFRILNEHTRSPVTNPAEKALRLGRSVGLANHTILVGKDGSETPISDSAAPIPGKEGEPVGVVLVFRDATQQRKAEATRGHLAAIVESSADAIFTKNLEGTIESWNGGAERLFGYPASEIVGQSITCLVPRELLDEEQQILERLHAGLPSERVETVRLAKDGRRLQISISVSPLRDQQGRVTGASTIIHDISLRKKAEAELVQAQLRLTLELANMRRLYELSTLLLRETDVPTMMRRVLDASVELLRARKGVVQLYDPADDALKVVAQVGFGDEFVQQFQSVPASQNFVSSAALKEKRRIIVEDYSKDAAFEDLREGAARHHIVASQSTPLYARDGTVFGILSTHFSAPHRPAENELRLLDLYAQQAERVIEHHRSSEAVRDAQEKLARINTDLENMVLERTAALQSMVNELEHVSYAITHDMRAPLRAMSTFAQLLIEDPSAQQLSPRAQDYCRRITTGANRLDTLIREALNYTKAVLQHLPMGAVNLDKLVRELIETYPNLHPEKADIRIEGQLPLVRGNESLLTQCFSNLLGNAVKFVPPERRPEVRVWGETDGAVVRVSVRDNGIGIPPHAHSRLFGMFQKLNTQFEGTGIGLAIVRKLAEQMGGTVGVESEAGHGSRFWIELPLA